MPDFEFLTLQTVVDLPSSIEREIGRAIVRYARLEFILAQMLFNALNLTPVQGRAAIKDESATLRFDLIKSLNEMDGLPAPKANLIELRKAIATVQRQRNDLAHSVWKRNSRGELLIRYTRGERDDDCGKAVSKSRKVAPEGASYSVEFARSLTALIDRAVTGLMEWSGEIVAQRKINARDNVPAGSVTAWFGDGERVGTGSKTNKCPKIKRHRPGVSNDAAVGLIFRSGALHDARQACRSRSSRPRTYAPYCCTKGLI